MKDFDAAATQFSVPNALALARAAGLAYQDAAAVDAGLRGWGMRGRFVESVSVHGDTQAFVAADDAKTVLAFRGTGQPLDFLSDAEFNQSAYHPTGSIRGKVHFGFLSALDDAWPRVRPALDEFHAAGRPLWVTGHSLGAALATLAVGRLRGEGVQVDGLYTFGSPRVGDHVFVQSFGRAAPRNVFRVVNHLDAVARVPLEKLGGQISYDHVGTMRYFDSSGVLSAGPSAVEYLEQAVEMGLDALAAGGVDRTVLAARLKVPLEEHGIARYIARLEAAPRAKPRPSGLLGWLSRLIGA